MKLLNFCLCILSLMNASVPGQTHGGNEDLKQFLVAPADSAEHYRKLEHANRLIEQKKWSEAETILVKLTKSYPLHGPTWGQLAIAFRHQSKYHDAIHAYKKVIEIQGPGQKYNARYWIAVSQAALGEIEATLKTLNQLVFVEGYLSRAELIEDPNFSNLKNDERFLSIAGKQDVSRLSRVDGWRLDIEYFTQELKRSNPANAAIPKEFFRLGKKLKDDVPDLTDLEIVAGLGRMLRTLDRGHTGLWLGAPGSKVAIKPMPVRFYIFPEGIFITEGIEEYAKLAGAQVLKFGNTPAYEALAIATSARSSESPMENLWISPLYLASPAVLQGLGITKDSERLELTLKMPDGSTIVKTMDTIEPKQPDLKLNPPPNVKPPLFLRNMKQMHWFESLSEQKAIYVQVNNILPDQDESMAEFGLRLRRAISEVKPRNIMLDLRHNNGGNTFTYPELLRTLIAFSTMEENRLFVLIGRNVYSAAANLTTDLERLARPIFVGEPTGATGNQWGDESIFILPYSGIMGAFAGVRWQISHPWDQRRSIVPQMPVQMTAKAYFEGRDPALEAIFQFIADES